MLNSVRGDFGVRKYSGHGTSGLEPLIRSDRDHTPSLCPRARRNAPFRNAGPRAGILLSWQPPRYRLVIFACCRRLNAGKPRAVAATRIGRTKRRAARVALADDISGTVCVPKTSSFLERRTLLRAAGQGTRNQSASAGYRPASRASLSIYRRCRKDRSRNRRDRPCRSSRSRRRRCHLGG
jgi:hypothetical protein